MKTARVILLFIALMLVGGVAYNLFSLRGGLEKEVKKLRAEMLNISEENKSLVHDIEYYKNKENLLKEVKSQFNYKEAGEGIIIIVPESSSTKR